MSINYKLKQEDSLKKRYLYKLRTNFLGLLISLVIQSIIPRGLGPSRYGVFSFLSTFFTKTIGFFDAGTSVGLYTKLSQRPHDIGLLRCYSLFTVLLSFLAVTFTAGIFMIKVDNWLWPEQKILYIWMALVWALLTWYAQIIHKILDAYGLTVSGENIRIIQRFIGLIIVLLMFWFNRFSLSEFFFYHYFILLFFCFSGWRVLRKQGIELFPRVKQTAQKLREYVKEFYSYSYPLITYAFVGLLVGGLDRWMLQKFAGSVQQGFYGLSYQIGAICFLFTSAMSPLLMREFAKAFEQKDLVQMRSLFQRYVPMLYAIAAFFGVFAFIQADKISLIVGGQSYSEASLAIGLMSLYPIHQTYGQLSGSVFYATGQTRLYRNIGIFVSLIGIPATIFLIAPSNWLGLELGATGLAIKMVIIQFLGVNLQLWFNVKLLGMSFWKFFAHQLYSASLLIAIAWLAATTVDSILSQYILSFLVSGIIYTLGCILLAFVIPSVFGVRRQELISLINSCFKKV